MKILIDTCTFLWILNDSSELSERARAVFLERENEPFVSSVTSWEICVKYSLKKLKLPSPPDKYIPMQRKKHGIQSLPLTEEATLHLVRLPELHRDPFDRMLVSQAMVEGMTLITPDPLIVQYPVRTEW